MADAASTLKRLINLNLTLELCPAGTGGCRPVIKGVQPPGEPSDSRSSYANLQHRRATSSSVTLSRGPKCMIL